MRIKSDKDFYKFWRLAEIKDLKPNLEYVFIQTNYYSEKELLKTSHNINKIDKFDGRTNESWNNFKREIKRDAVNKRIWIRK